jgi:starch synthase (maltosyl-transferring)
MTTATKILIGQGASRVVIDRVSPDVESEQFPHKYVLGECVNVEADIFADGHDKVAAVFQYKKHGEKEYTELRLEECGNDLWKVDFWPEEVAYYNYNFAGWIDHYSTWLAGIKKKLENKQDVAVELLIGAQLIQAACDRAVRNDSIKLDQYAGSMGNENIPIAVRLELLEDEDLHNLVLKYPNRENETRWAQDGILFIERNRAAFSAWYEFFPRSFGEKFGEHGTFKSAKKMIPKIADMGFNIIYFPPIHPIGQKFRKGKNNTLTASSDDVGSPWAVGSDEGGHKAVNPWLGNLSDFSDFINAAKKHNIEVALDIAFQCAPDHPYVTTNPQWFKWRPDNTVQYAENPPKKYQDILPFNFECDDWKNLWEELKSVFLFWIAEGVKVFRVDNPHTKPVGFWHWCICEIKKDHPDVIFLAEAFTRPKVKYRLGKIGFTHGYTYFTWRNSKEEIIKYMAELSVPELRHTFWPNFWPNTPDILHEYLQVGGRPAFIIRYILAATLSSNIGIYGPAYELCDNEPFPGKEENNNNEKYELKSWDLNSPLSISAIIRRMNQLRNDNPALQRTNNLEFVEIDNPNMIAYYKKSPDMLNIVLIVVNLDFSHSQEGWLHMPLEKLHIKEGSQYLMQDMLPEHKSPMPEANYLWSGERNYIKLNPHESPAHVFRVFRNQKKENNFDYWL